MCLLPIFIIWKWHIELAQSYGRLTQSAFLHLFDLTHMPMCVYLYVLIFKEIYDSKIVPHAPVILYMYI